MKLVISRKYSREYLDRIKELDPEMEIVFVENPEDQEREIQDADILLTRMMPENVNHAEKLRWIQFIWEGVEDISEELKNSRISVTNAGGVHSIQMAEHVFSYVFTHFRKVWMYMDMQRRSEWLPWKDQPPLRRITGAKIGILGYGRIGRAIARISKGFDMEVLAYKRDPLSMEMKGFSEGTCCDAKGLIPDRIFGPGELDEMLPLCDVIVVTLPLTGSTRGLIGQKEFDLMKDNTYFINVGRGSVVNEEAMIEALRRGKLDGAGLDVFHEEPLSPHSPLWTMENVIVTPHSGVGGDPGDDKVIKVFLENLNRFRKGDELINLIDKKRGY